MNAASRFLWSCVSSPVNTALTALVLLLAAVTLPDLIKWLIADAAWTGSTAGDCTGRDAACWVFLHVRADQILYGTYPAAERWRVIVALIVALCGMALLTRQRHGFSLSRSLAILAGTALVVAVLMCGGIAGLPVVPTGRWGGMLLTAIIAAWTIATALPLGLLLALARRSELPLVAAIAGGFIDIVRSLPLVGILFLAIVLFPLFVPPGVETDKLLRALLAFTVFNAANLAEVFRGGLQAVPTGHIEAGRSLGLTPWRVTQRIVVPQAVAVSLPGVVNVCIAVVKETTIVLIVGLFDFLGVLQAGLADPEWLAAESARTTAYVFAGLVFWAVCFALSRYSLSLERRLAPERR